jgi:large subunit ribosomal protein L13
MLGCPQDGGVVIAPRATRAAPHADWQTRREAALISGSEADAGGCRRAVPGAVPVVGAGRTRKTLMKTFSAKPAEVTHEWFVLDATDKVLGRVASEVALRLRGKHKAIYTPHVDTGDFIIVVNADKIRVTGAKAEDKMYYRHSGHPGGIHATSFKEMQAKHPGRAIEKAVKGMLPKGPLGYAMIKKLKVYAGGSHPHAAQQPKALEI